MPFIKVVCYLSLNYYNAYYYSSIVYRLNGMRLYKYLIRCFKAVYL